MNVSFELATAADDPALRRLLARNPVPGSISVAYTCEPNYFAAAALAGPFNQTLLARVQANGEIAGLLLRAVRPRFVHGDVQPVGYFGQLRVDTRYQGQGLIRQGMASFQHLHADGRASIYLASIIAGNRRAQRLLVEDPPWRYPRFHLIDRMRTLALPARPRPALAGHDLAVLAGDGARLAEILAFMQQHGARRQFFPCIAAADLEGPTLAGLRAEDFVLAQRRGRLLGVLALWDQSQCKQALVQRYSGPLRTLRPLLNAAARALELQPLPAPGAPLRSLYASFVCVADDDHAVFAALLRHALNQAAARGYAFLLLGLSSRDPLLAVARRYAHIPYASDVYLVTCDEEGDRHVQLDRRVPYVEIATL